MNLRHIIPVVTSLVFFWPWLQLDLAAQPVGTPNRVLELDGQGSYVELPSAALQGLKEFTIEMWVKPALFGRRTTVLHIGSYEPGARSFILELQQSAAANEFSVALRPVRNSPPIACASELRLEPDRWYHLAITVRRNRFQSCINGMLIGETELIGEIGPAEETTPFRVGRFKLNDADPEANVFSGQLDEIRLWREGRQPAQIRETMFQRLRGDEPSLAGLWNFDDATARDRSAGSNAERVEGLLFQGCTETHRLYWSGKSLTNLRNLCV